MGPKPGTKWVTLPGRGEGVPGTAALKVTMRGGGRRWDEPWRGRGGLEKSCGCRHEAPPSPVPRPREGTPGRTQRAQKPAHLYNLPVRARQETTCEGPPETTPPTSPKPAAVCGTPNAGWTPAATLRPPCSVRPPPQVICPIAPVAGGRRPPLTSPSSRNHFPRVERKKRLQEDRGGGVRASGKRREGGFGPRRVCSRLAGLGAPRGGAIAPRGGDGREAQRLGFHQSGLPTHAALRGGGGGGGGGGTRPGPAPAQSPAAAEWPPASPQDPPPRLRKAAHRARRAQPGQLRRPHSAIRNGSSGRCSPRCEHCSPARTGRGPWPRESGRPSTRGLRAASGRSPVGFGWPGWARGRELSPVPVWRSLLSTPTRLPLHAGGAAVPAATAAAAAAALAGRGHVTRPAGSLGAGGRGGSAARTGTGSPAARRGRLRGGPGEHAPGRRARARRLALATRSGKGGGSEGRGTHASARPSLSSFP